VTSKTVYLWRSSEAAKKASAAVVMMLKYVK